LCAIYFTLKYRNSADPPAKFVKQFIYLGVTPPNAKKLAVTLESESKNRMVVLKVKFFSAIEDL
tara:strand:- start:123 stop:314 length:192 start_codon:yes stop_codon:yes gene_type:complete